MKSILFIREYKAFLPEIDAYIKYFNKSDEFKAYDSSKLEKGYNINDFDIIWEFKGCGGLKLKDKVLIHEYASLSTGSLPLLKNLIKSKLNPKPNLRIFLNKQVGKGFKFEDNINFCYRDMGIDESFLDIESNKEKEYDFVYVGSICKNRNMHKLLEVFSKTKPGKLCLIGSYDNEIYNLYKNDKHITFTGKVSYSEVPQIASKAIYGINYIPDKYPFNIQTSTKLLEYLAMGLKVVTTNYQWIKEFEKENECNFYKLNNDLELNMKSIMHYDFKSCFNPENYLWDNIIEKSNIKKMIRLHLRQTYLN